MNQSSPLGSKALEGQDFLTVQDPRWRTTFCGTPLDEWTACRRDLYPTTHKTKNMQTSMPPAGFESTFPTSERPQTLALDRAATGNTNETFNSAIIQRPLWRVPIRLCSEAAQLVESSASRANHSLPAIQRFRSSVLLIVGFATSLCTTCLPAITVTCPDQSSSLF
jgi:hypothetical protein